MSSVLRVTLQDLVEWAVLAPSVHKPCSCTVAPGNPINDASVTAGCCAMRDLAGIIDFC